MFFNTPSKDFSTSQIPITFNPNDNDPSQVYYRLQSDLSIGRLDSTLCTGFFGMSLASFHCGVKGDPNIIKTNSLI